MYLVGLLRLWDYLNYRLFFLVCVVVVNDVIKFGQCLVYLGLVLNLMMMKIIVVQGIWVGYVYFIFLFCVYDKW